MVFLQIAVGPVDVGPQPRGGGRRRDVPGQRAEQAHDDLGVAPRAIDALDVGAGDLADVAAESPLGQRDRHAGG